MSNDKMDNWLLGYNKDRWVATTILVEDGKRKIILKCFSVVHSYLCIGKKVENFNVSRIWYPKKWRRQIVSELFKHNCTLPARVIGKW